MHVFPFYVGVSLLKLTIRKKGTLITLGLLGNLEEHDIIHFSTWTPQLCKIIDFMAVILGLGLVFYNQLSCRVKLRLHR